MKNLISQLVNKGENWKKSRQAISPTFTGGKLKQMVPVVQTCVDKLQAVLKQFADNGEAINIKSSVAIHGSPGFITLAQGFGRQNDFLQLLLDLETENGSTQNATRSTVFSNNDLITHCITFLIAGYETTSSCLAYTSYLLAINPDVQEKLCQELDNYFKDHSVSTDIYEATHDIEYLDMVVQESLRIFPPAPLAVGRMCTENIQLGGLDIPKGTAVIVPVMSIHQDPKIWEDPMNFRPERFSAEEKERRPQLCHLPFGWGPHNCIGMRFALMEVKMALISILQKYKFMQALETEVPLQTVASGLTLQPKNGIYVKIQSRN
ncbi:hypothetical protein EMCRGX_G017245 [Ephydatia muelleri]